MKDRIRAIRKQYNLTQEDFGKKIGMLNSGVSRLESGQATPTEQTVRLILSEFPVSEGWLRDGIGEMLSDDRAARKQRLRDGFNKEGDPFKDWLLDQVVEMDDAQWGLLQAKLEEWAAICAAGGQPEADAEALAREYEKGLRDGIASAKKNDVNIS
jgi:transcriptional regulator with XRE-family HTH domain